MALLDSSMFPAKVIEYYEELKDTRPNMDDVWNEYEVRKNDLLEQLAAGVKFNQLLLDPKFHHQVREFTAWLFCEGGEIQFDGIIWPYRVNDYSVTFLPTDEGTMEQFKALVDSLHGEWPLAWADAVEEEIYVNVPLPGGVQAAMADTGALLRRAGYATVADAIEFARFDREIPREELVAANISGALLAGIDFEYITDFQAQGVSTGLVPLWTEMTNSGMSQDEMIETYNRALRKLMEARNVV